MANMAAAGSITQIDIKNGLPRRKNNLLTRPNRHICHILTAFSPELPLGKSQLTCLEDSPRGLREIVKAYGYDLKTQTARFTGLDASKARSSSLSGFDNRQFVPVYSRPLSHDSLIKSVISGLSENFDQLNVVGLFNRRHRRHRRRRPPPAEMWELAAPAVAIFSTKN